nr:MAG: hypothetical protein [Wenzhou shrew ribovirus 1]
MASRRSRSTAARPAAVSVSVNPLTPAPQQPTQQRRRRRKIKAAPPPPTTRRRRRFSRRSTPPRSTWFHLGDFYVRSTDQPGLLETVMLHPAAFPDTPYYASCANHASRDEVVVDLEVYCTSASMTGLRCAVIFIPCFQSMPTDIPSSVVWTSVKQGQAAMVNSVGTGHTRARFRLNARGLSNQWPTTHSWVGFSAGSVGVYLLEPPIGLTADVTVTMSVLASVTLTAKQPMTGYMLWAANPGESTEGREEWSLTCTSQNAMPLNTHNASAWLAGGQYLRLRPNGPRGLRGSVWVYGVYVSNHHPYNWMNNDSVRYDPGYLCIWHEPGSSVIQVVGFVDLTIAKNQADGNTSQVPHGAECCILYHNGNINYGEKFQGLVNADQEIRFTLVYRGKNSYHLQFGDATFRLGGEDQVAPLRRNCRIRDPAPRGPSSPRGQTTSEHGYEQRLAALEGNLRSLSLLLPQASPSSKPLPQPSAASTQPLVGSSQACQNCSQLSVPSPQPSVPLPPPPPPSNSVSNQCSQLPQDLPQPSEEFMTGPRVYWPDWLNTNLSSNLSTSEPAVCPNTSETLTDTWLQWQPPSANRATTPNSTTSSWSTHSARFVEILESSVDKPSDGWSRSLELSALHECPGCDDPDCDDCFEDDCE